MKFNVRWAIIPGGAAFFFAFVISLAFGQVGFGLALLRALIFAALFAGIGFCAWALISRFVPELLAPPSAYGEDQGLFHNGQNSRNKSSYEAAGSVDITLDDGLEAALPGASYGIEGVGNIADLISGSLDANADGGLDQARTKGYNSELERIGAASAPADRGAPRDADPPVDGPIGSFSSFIEGLADRGSPAGIEDSLSDLFQTLSGDGRITDSGLVEDAPVERKPIANRPAEVKGDYSPKELASGIRTALVNDKKRG
ncbi:MAG: hypothetical protein FWE09_09630 [Treponema sp.]|nr:hypothetical protein [Treponema sp.]